MSSAQGVGSQSTTHVHPQQPQVQAQPQTPTDPHLTEINNVFKNHSIEISDTPPSSLSNHEITPKPLDALLKSAREEFNKTVTSLTDNVKALTDLKINKVAATILGITAGALIVGGIVACILFPPASLGALAAVVVVGCVVCVVGGGVAVWQMMKCIDDVIHTETLKPEQIAEIERKQNQLMPALALLDGPEAGKFRTFLESAPKRKNDQGIDTYELKDLNTYVELYELKKKIDDTSADPAERQQLQGQYDEKLNTLKQQIGKPLPPPQPKPPTPPTSNEMQEYHSRGARIHQLNEELQNDKIQCEKLGIAFEPEAIKKKIDALEGENRGIKAQSGENDPTYLSNQEAIKFLNGIEPKINEYKQLCEAQNKANEQFNASALNNSTRVGEIERKIADFKGKLDTVEKQLQPAELLKAQIAQRQEEIKAWEVVLKNRPANQKTIELLRKQLEIQEKIDEPIGAKENTADYATKHEKLNAEKVKVAKEIKDNDNEILKVYSDKITTAKAEIENLKTLANDPNPVLPPSDKQTELENHKKNLIGRIRQLEQQVTDLKKTHPQPTNPATPVNPANPVNPVNPNAPLNAGSWFDTWKTKTIAPQNTIDFQTPKTKPEDAPKYLHPAVRTNERDAIYVFGNLNDRQDMGPTLVTLKGTDPEEKKPAQTNFGGQYVQKVWDKLGYNNPDNNYLSLFHPQQIKVDGKTYASPIHYLLLKRIEQDPYLKPETRTILENYVHQHPDPKALYKQAKDNWVQFGHIHGDRANPDSCLFGSPGMENELKKVLYHKFVGDDGNPNELGKKLVASGNKPLYAGNEPGGTVFGMQLVNKDMMIGENKLGQCLMSLRTELATRDMS